MTMKCLRHVLLAVAAAGPAGAQPAPVRLAYAAYFGGIDVADMQASLVLSPQAYRVQLSFALTGALGALFHAEGTSTVDGRFQGDAAEPRELFSTGRFRGETRVTQIDWRGGRPTVTQMLPPLEPERERVPDADQLHTIDPLSAMAVLLHRVWTTGACDADARTFDGRWLSEIAARTVGEEGLDPTGRSSFQGTALRCDIEGHQLAGFVRDTDEASLHKPHRASVWFARTVPGGPLLPVRIALENRGFGSATMYLTGQG